MPTAQVLDSYDRHVDPSEWDALVGEASPFLESAFLCGLEATGCVGPGTGWLPRPVVVRDEAGRLVAAAPAWLKQHSMGEFVYDHAWANAARQHGIPYYPKLVVAVPFTPVTGRRLLTHPEVDRDAVLPTLLQGLQRAAEEARGLHVLFDPPAEAERLEGHGAFSRIQYQYWWHNDGYDSFADFLAPLRSKYRKEIRRERRKIDDLRIERVVAPTPEQMDHLFDFYADTCEKYPWGRQYLHRDFFDHLAGTWGDRVLGVLAYDGGDRPIAGALDVFKGDRLYGRYWGCHEEVKFLHFEVCYHQGIEFAIERGLTVFEPGHGGEHKYRRGFLPEITWSSHWFADPRLAEGLAAYSTREARAVRSHVREKREESPYKELPSTLGPL